MKLSTSSAKERPRELELIYFIGRFCRRRSPSTGGLSRDLQRPSAEAYAPGGEGRVEPLLLLLRCSLHRGVSNRDRHPKLHSQDREWEYPRRCDGYSERKRHGRYLRARVSSGDALPSCLRARAPRRQ